MGDKIVKLKALTDIKKSAIGTVGLILKLFTMVIKNSTAKFVSFAKFKSLMTIVIELKI